MKIVITRKIPPSIVSLMEDGHEVYMWDDEETVMPRQLLLQHAADADAIFTNVSDRIDKELLGRAPRLKVVSTMAVGYNNIDIAEAKKRGIRVGHTPEVLSEAVADLTFALLLGTARRVVEADRYTRAGKWKGWGPMLLTGQDVYGAAIGIIGMGRIGRGVARRAKGFGMHILYHNRTRKPEAEQELGAQWRSLEQLLSESDYVVMLAPSTPETHSMIGPRQFAQMKPNAILINTSRGGNVDEQALYDALTTGKIWGAGLDVFETEPIGKEHPLLQLPNVIALPHIGSATIETRLQMADIAARNLLAALRNERMLYSVIG
ncbi:2-hydroxyacid dehydrogenase [Paenibacillus sp. TAB 01]|uniref:2-hydroxyacid dehydrogenase n=1 Tax=Paenibacillus sp. TAB 01 TaxID=3368988 RepID=UPI00375306AD